MFKLSLSLVFVSVLANGLGVLAIPTLAPPVQARSEVTVVTTMTSAQTAALAPYTEFARAAYCSPDIVQGWDCGEACEAVPGVEISLTGGDGDSIQYYYVGYWPSENSVVVAHQGTDPTQFLSDLTDADIPMENLNATLFPGVDSSVEVHSGFANEHAQTASIILAEVKSLIAQYGATMVTLVGHSLGGALAELDCLFMALNLPADIAIQGRTYGTPRVGNPAWATLFDATISDFMRINNEKDIIPIVPGRFLGFSHVYGEVHIVAQDDLVECPGDDDATDAQCTIMTVPNVFDGDILDHLGPYQGIYIGTIYCT
ncbi:Alpha/Beta hydrolase protein [Hygrophoropsis aurantiaca]|uniref:Alpha/Beta hydrolase protein n=1 Tax=Hygrophoropsis aurantiaca TaxID=72124 RepID=A0ACB8AGQ5_9AGAM|nr:Alpha/Beta hydrolase protein [Hygrophoropsis aurantiaca]